jgi:hypothetical protein
MKKNDTTQKVHATPQGSGYVPGIRIAGKWLIELGFTTGTEVSVNFNQNQITITKIKN